MEGQDSFIHSLLKKRDEEIGANGSYSFLISIRTNQELYENIIGVNNLTLNSARNMFDLFDENNKIFPNNKGNVYEMKISIYDSKGNEIDFNLIPNIHSEQ